jgi:hypothetical protein
MDMNTIADIANEIGGTNPVAMYVSPEYDATLARAIQSPRSGGCRIHHLLLVFARPSAPASDPCLIVSSETPEDEEAPVLVIYDKSGQGILRKQRGDWVDIETFGRRAVALASQRLGVTFEEYDFQRKGA